LIIISDVSQPASVLIFDGALKEAVLANRTIDVAEGFDFLPESLVRQCLDLIEKFHDVQGYRCLPDMLWRLGLGPTIERNRSFRKLLDKASRSRSAKIANENFVRIATTYSSPRNIGQQFCGLEHPISRGCERGPRLS
jgi:hypothetical protein